MYDCSLFLYLCIVRVREHILLIFALILAVGCQQKAPDYLSCQGAMLGTTFSVTADVSGISAPELYSEIMKIDTAMKSSMSIFNPKSRLMRINSNLTDSVDCHIAYNLALARQISELSDGAYDVTVKPLVEAWGFARKERNGKPNIDSLLEFVGYQKVEISDNRIIKSDPRIELDFNSIAKGYTVDLVAKMLEDRGAQNYLVDIGGEVRAKGKNHKGNPWRVGVERPVDGAFVGQGIEMILSIEDGGLATSGNYRRYFVDERGQKVAHTISPKTGYSVVTRLLSATVVAESCARADALATMFMSMGDVAALEFAKANPEMPTLLIFAREDGDNEYECYISPSMSSMIKN